MKTLSEVLDGAVSHDHELLRQIDAWSSEVLGLRKDSLWPGDDPGGSNLDDLFGTYVARDRLERIPGSGKLRVVAVIDALLESFTEEVGRDWIALTGMESDAGDGWWWARLPISGPVRDDFDEYQALISEHGEDPESNG